MWCVGFFKMSYVNLKIGRKIFSSGFETKTNMDMLCKEYEFPC